MCLTCFRFSLIALTLWAWPALSFETWVLADGRMFEAQVKLVTPGTVLFTLRTGAEQPLEVSKLSERSRKQLIELLGLGLTPVTPVSPVAMAPTIPTPTPASATAPAATPATPPPATPMTTAARESGAVDATDIGSLEASFGLAATVVGKVKKVVTLGSSGHKLLEFDGTDFNVFINRRQAELPGWNFDAMAGKTVQAKGKIGKFNEKLQIQLYAPAELTLVQ